MGKTIDHVQSLEWRGIPGREPKRLFSLWMVSQRPLRLARDMSAAALQFLYVCFCVICICFCFVLLFRSEIEYSLNSRFDNNFCLINSKKYSPPS